MSEYFRRTDTLKSNQRSQNIDMLLESKLVKVSYFFIVIIMSYAKNCHKLECFAYIAVDTLPVFLENHGVNFTQQFPKSATLTY